MFCETKRNVKSWAVFNFAAILTVLCYHMCLWLVDIDSKWLPPQLYQVRSYRNPTLLSYETCLLPYSNVCLQFILDTFCYVLLRLRLWFPPVGTGLKGRLSPFLHKTVFRRAFLSETSCLAHFFIFTTRSPRYHSKVWFDAIFLAWEMLHHYFRRSTKLKDFTTKLQYSDIVFFSHWHLYFEKWK